MEIKIVAFTESGAKLCASLAALLNKNGYRAEGFCRDDYENLSCIKEDLGEFTKNAFKLRNGIIFIGAAGIAVRTVAPYLSGKEKDPAVLVVDEGGKFVIPILSGHIGGANKLAQEVAELLGATPVITTATDINGLFAVDVWAVERDLRIIDTREIKLISSALLAGETVGLSCDFPVKGNLPEGIKTAREGKVGISISFDETKRPFEKTLRLKPKVYSVGVGCQKYASYGVLEEFFLKVLEEHNLTPDDVLAVATIDLKKDEPAIHQLCRNYCIKLVTYTPQELLEVGGEFTRSDFVKFVTGVDNVCERAAKRATGGEIIMKKNCCEHVALSIAKKDWVCEF